MARSKESPGFTEVDLQRWLSENLSGFLDSIVNLEQLSTKLQERLDGFRSKPRSRLVDTLRDAVTATLDRKFLYTLKALEEGSDLISLGCEFPLIKSGLPGRNPAADILALQSNSAAYAIIEIKISADAAREAVTELSAYGQGLGHRYLGLNSFDAIWLVVSTEFRPTLLEAVAYQMLIADRCIVPIKASVTAKDGTIEDVELEIVEIEQVPHACSTDALFSNEVFDGVAVNFPAKVSSPDVALHFISNACTRLGATGFCFQVYASEMQEHEYMYPHGLYIGTLNPFKLYQLSAQLNELLKRGHVRRDSAEYEDWIFKGVHEDFDVDLTTYEVKWTPHSADDGREESDEVNFAGIPFDHSLLELSIRETNSLTIVFESIFNQLTRMHSGGTGAEVGGTSFSAMFFPFAGRPTYREDNISSIRYFGFLHDVVVNIAELLAATDPDFNGMTLADVYQSPRLLLKLISIGKPEDHGTAL